MLKSCSSNQKYPVNCFIKHKLSYTPVTNLFRFRSFLITLVMCQEWCDSARESSSLALPWILLIGLLLNFVSVCVCVCTTTLRKFEKFATARRSCSASKDEYMCVGWMKQHGNYYVYKNIRAKVFYAARNSFHEPLRFFLCKSVNLLLLFLSSAICCPRDSLLDVWM